MDKWIHHPDFIFPVGNVYEGLMQSRAKEQIAAGPAETAKSIHLAMKLHAFASHYPGMHIAIVRAAMEDLKNTFCVTFEDKVLGQDCYDKNSFVYKFGGKDGRSYYYRNGTEIVLVGLDRNPGKVLGAEFDIIYCMQVEQLNYDDYQQLVQRANGRSGNLKDEDGTPYGMVMGCCNPGPDDHWLLDRRKNFGKKTLREIDERSESDRKALDWFDTVLTDNPKVFRLGVYTTYGKTVLAQNEMLTGIKYQRLVLGLWVGHEGLVYDIPREKYIIKRGNLPDLTGQDWVHVRGVDYGWHRFVCLWGAYSKEQNLLIIYKEYRWAERIVEDHAEMIKEYTDEFIEWSVSDHDAEDRETMHKAGIQTRNAKKERRPGIDLVHQKLSHGNIKVYEGLQDGMPHCPVIRGNREVPNSIFNEFQRYRYKPKEKRTGRNPKEDDLPLKEGVDDAADVLRYIACEFWLGKKIPRSEKRVIRVSRTKGFFGR